VVITGRDVDTIALTSQGNRHKLIYTVARRSPPDPKLEALNASGCLNRRPERVTDAVFKGDEFFDARDLVQVKYEMLRRVSIDGVPVTTSASVFGFSRPSFYQAQAAFERAGIQGLVPAKPGPRRAHKLSEEVIDFIEKELAAGADRSSAELARLVKERFGRDVHPRSVERALARREKKRRARTPGR
jgi:transposase